VRGHIQSVKKWFLASSRSLNFRMRPYSKSKHINFVSEHSQQRISWPSIKQLYGLPEPILAYDHLQWHILGNHKLNPGRLTCLNIKVNLLWSQETLSRKLTLVFHFGISILWIICLASRKPNPPLIIFYYLTKLLKIWTTQINHSITIRCSTVIKS